MIRVLVVGAQLPRSEGTAAGRCVAAMVSGLRTHPDLDVRVVAPRWPAEAGQPDDELEVEVVDLDLPHGGFGARWDNLRHPVAELARGPFADRVHHLAETADVVHLEQIETACLLPRLARARSVVHLHYRAALDAPLGAPWKPAFRRRLGFVRAEGRALAMAPRLLANSDDVAQSMRADAPGTEVDVVPLAIEPSHYIAAEHAGPPVVGILGTASWAPTSAAMTTLVKAVWPLIRARHPDARLLVAGRGTAEHADRWTAPGVTVLGEVDSAAEFLAQLSVLVYPAAQGSGTKVKVLEALACGVPVVTTRPGAEGLTPNGGLLVAGGSADVADAVSSLLDDPAERRRRGQAGRAYVESRHAPAAVAGLLAGVYQRTLR